MSNPNRPDVIESKRIDKCFDFESMIFEDIHWLFHDFIKEILIKEKTLEELGVSKEVIDKTVYYNEQIEKFLLGLISAETINQEGSNSWLIHKKLTGKDKDVLRFVLAGLCDEKKAFFHEYGASMLIGQLIHFAYQIDGEHLSKLLGNYIEQYPRMQKYKLNL